MFFECQFMRAITRFFQLPFFILAFWSSLATAQTLSLTFDDGLNPDTQADARLWNQQILDTLKGSDISAMVFPALVRVGGSDGKGLALLSDWSKAGHAVGNHTATHQSLASSKLSLNDFIADVKAADGVLRRFPTWEPMLRFPYLKEGDTLEKRDGMRAWMKTSGYRPAPVSIDASDWYFNQIYAAQMKAGDADKAVKVKAAYVEHLLNRAAYYDGLAKQVTGRSPQHVMLLHTSQINAAALADIVAAFKARGWTFVSPLQAFKDSLYGVQTNTLPAGESIVWAMAKEQGVAALRYPAEDSVYEEPGLREAGLLP